MDEIDLSFTTKKYISTRKELAAELVKVLDQYTDDKISEKQLESAIQYLATQYSAFLFEDETKKEINVTIRRKIGIRRLFLLKNIMDNLNK